MKYERMGYLLLLLVAVMLVASAALSAPSGAPEAQTTVEASPEAPAEGTQEAFFNDNRINNRIVLGEFGIFCEDEQGIATSSYEGGGISVYGANGERYIFAPEEALRQMSSDMMDETAEAGGNAMSTDEAEMMGTPQPPILLGQAFADYGVVRLFLTGDNQFQLSGVLPDGRGFRYNWTGCTGNTGIDTDEVTPQPFITTTPVPTLGTPIPTANATMTSESLSEPTMNATTTAEATTSP